MIKPETCLKDRERAPMERLGIDYRVAPRTEGSRIIYVFPFLRLA